MWWSNQTTLKRFCLFICVFPLLYGCTNTASRPSTQTEQALETQLQEVLTAWRENPSSERLEALTALCDRELRRSHASSFELLLADALSNAIMRPDLALPLFQDHLTTLSHEQEESWLNALMRSQDLERLAKELGQRRDIMLNPMHPTARILAAQALHNPALDWRQFVDGTHAAELIESFYAQETAEFDRRIKQPQNLIGQLVRLTEGQPVEVAIARTTLATDKDPYLTPGEIPAWDHRRRIIAYATGRTQDDLAAASHALAQRSTLKTLTVAIRQFDSPHNARVWGFEATYRDKTLWAFSTVNPETVQRWLAEPHGKTP